MVTFHNFPEETWHNGLLQRTGKTGSTLLYILVQDSEPLGRNWTLHGNAESRAFREGF